MSAERILVTGASGYLGTALAAALEARGHTVVRTQRRGAEGPGVLTWALGDRAPEAGRLRALGISAVVHCAYDFAQTSWPELLRVNVEGTTALARAARDAGATRQIFISTLSAFPGCMSDYGRAKLESERLLGEVGALILRPGLLYSAAPRGLVGTISRLAARLPVLPLIGSGNQVQYTCHLDDLCAGIARLLEDPAWTPTPRPITAAHATGLRFRDVVRLLAARAGRARLLLVPVPWRLVWLGLRTVEAIGLRPGLRSDSVIGLEKALVGPPDFAETEGRGLAFRRFSA